MLIKKVHSFSWQLLWIWSLKTHHVQCVLGISAQNLVATGTWCCIQYSDDEFDYALKVNIRCWRSAWVYLRFLVIFQFLQMFIQKQLSRFPSVDKYWFCTHCVIYCVFEEIHWKNPHRLKPLPCINRKWASSVCKMKQTSISPLLTSINMRYLFSVFIYIFIWLRFRLNLDIYVGAW